MQKRFLLPVIAALLTGVSSHAGIVTTIGYENSKLLDKHGTNLTIGYEQSNLRVSGTTLLNSKGTAVTYGVKANAVIPVKRIEFTPGIGYEWYNNHTPGNKGDMNFNVGIDFKLTDRVLLGSTYKAVLYKGKFSDDSHSIQSNVTVKW